MTCIEVDPDLVSIVIQHTDSYVKINDTIGTVSNVFSSKKSFSLMSPNVYTILEKDNTNCNLRESDDVFVNWKLYSHCTNEKGRLPLFTASEQGVKWSEGLGMIVNGNGGAIEDIDVITGLEAFMLAAIGNNSDMETVYKLLQDHPAAINPHVSL